MMYNSNIVPGCTMPLKPHRARYVSFWSSSCKVTFFLSGSPLIQNTSTNEILGTPTFVSQATKVFPTFFRLDITNLPILQIGDIQGRSNNSSMPFHSGDLVH